MMRRGARVFTGRMRTARTWTLLCRQAVCPGALTRTPGLPACSTVHTLTPPARLQVVVRVRPPVYRELNDWEPFQNTVHVGATQQELNICENLQAYQTDGTGVHNGLLYSHQRFTFDHIFTQDSTQHEVYETAAQPAVASALQGYNAAIIAYGQTGTGARRVTSLVAPQLHSASCTSPTSCWIALQCAQPACTHPQCH